MFFSFTFTLELHNTRPLPVTVTRLRQDDVTDGRGEVGFALLITGGATRHGRRLTVASQPLRVGLEGEGGAPEGCNDMSVGTLHFHVY